jgi:hypothetical protein
MKTGTGVDRKRFLMLGLAAGLASFACRTAAQTKGEAQDEPAVVVHVHGVLPHPLGEGRPNSHLDFTVSGPASDLSGTGRSSYDLSSVPPERVVSSFSVWDCRGALRGNQLSLSGITSLANYCPILGAPVGVDVDLSTAECTWTMGQLEDGRPQFGWAKGKATVVSGELVLRGASAGVRQPGTAATSDMN